MLPEVEQTFDKFNTLRDKVTKGLPAGSKNILNFGLTQEGLASQKALLDKANADLEVATQKRKQLVAEYTKALKINGLDAINGRLNQIQGGRTTGPDNELRYDQEAVKALANLYARWGVQAEHVRDVMVGLSAEERALIPGAEDITKGWNAAGDAIARQLVIATKDRDIVKEINEYLRARKGLVGNELSLTNRYQSTTGSAVERGNSFAGQFVATAGEMSATTATIRTLDEAILQLNTQIAASKELFGQEDQELVDLRGRYTSLTEAARAFKAEQDLIRGGNKLMAPYAQGASGLARIERGVDSTTGYSTSDVTALNNLLNATVEKILAVKAAIKDIPGEEARLAAPLATAEAAWQGIVDKITATLAVAKAHVAETQAQTQADKDALAIAVRIAQLRAFQTNVNQFNRGAATQPLSTTGVNILSSTQLNAVERLANSATAAEERLNAEAGRDGGRRRPATRRDARQVQSARHAVEGDGGRTGRAGEGDRQPQPRLEHAREAIPGHRLRLLADQVDLQRWRSGRWWRCRR